MKLYGHITKVTPLDDGTIRVQGVASSEAIDSDGEVVTAAAVKAALPEYMRFGAVREMHGLNAAGTALEAEVGDDGKTRIVAHVVDPLAVQKVKAGVYKGFSIGGRATARTGADRKTISGLTITEISLVDRPANPEAIFDCWKAAVAVPVVATDDVALAAIIKARRSPAIGGRSAIAKAQAGLRPAVPVGASIFDRQMVRPPADPDAATVSGIKKALADPTDRRLEVLDAATSAAINRLITRLAARHHPATPLTADESQLLAAIREFAARPIPGSDADLLALLGALSPTQREALMAAALRQPAT